jgi:hypothetical protein
MQLKKLLVCILPLYYSDNKTGIKFIRNNWGIIWIRKSILTGLHPELSPKNLELLSKMILWATGNI